MKIHTTKIYIALFLTCASVMGADSGILVTSTTNYTGVNNSVVYKLDVFTRDGQTNLVCETSATKDGTVLFRVQSFYHDGLKLGSSLTTTIPERQDFVTEAGSPYSLLFRPRSEHNTGMVFVNAKDGSLVELFAWIGGVDGLYYPEDRRLIAAFNENTAMQQTGKSAK